MFRVWGFRIESGIVLVFMFKVLTGEMEEMDNKMELEVIKVFQEA